MKKKKGGGVEAAGGQELTGELKPGDFAVVFHPDGEVEVFVAEGGSDERGEEINFLVDYLEFVLNDETCWERFENLGEESETPTVSDPKLLN